LGSHLVPALLTAFDCEVEAVDIDFRKLETSDARVHRRVSRVEAPGLVDEITSRCDLVISLTALCNPALYSTMPLEVIDASYTHLVPLVARCSELGVRLIHFSTAEVYGRTALDEHAQPAREMNEDASSLVLGPVHRERWSYACAKQLLERLIWAHGQHRGLAFTIVRPFNVIGSRMDYVNGIDGQGIPRVLASFMTALLRGHELPLVDGGAQKRSFMSTSDMARAVCKMIEHADACRGEIFNIGNPRNNVSIRDLAERMIAAYRQRVPKSAMPRLRDIAASEFYGAGYDDSVERIPDIGKARRLLNWEPRDTLDGMLPSIIDDYVVRYG
jgi:UDP-apiose/xylose synthase